MPEEAHRNFANKRLVIFGCGYVGSVIALEAIKRGLHVTSLTRNASTAATLRHAGVETVVADIAETAWHQRVPGSPDFVLNCVSSGGGGVAAYRQSYLAGMESVVAWTKGHSAAGTFVYTSSTSVYPQNDGSCVDESAATGGTERADILLQAESILRQATNCYGRGFILRLAGIYGPFRHHLLNQVRAGEIPGRGDYLLNLAHRDDIAAAVWACFSASDAVLGTTLNVTDDRPATKLEIAGWLALQLGLPAPKFTGEAPDGRRSNSTNRVISNARLKATLDWRPRFPTFREGYETLLSR